MHGPQLWYAEQFNGASVVPAAVIVLAGGLVVADVALVGFPAAAIVIAGGLVVADVALVGFA